MINRIDKAPFIVLDGFPVTELIFSFEHFTEIGKLAGSSVEQV